MNTTRPTIALAIATTLAPAVGTAGVPDDPPAAAQLMQQRPGEAGQSAAAATLANLQAQLGAVASEVRAQELAAAGRAVIGVNVSDVDTALGAQLGLEPGAGVLVTSVTDGMPAAEAGMQPYDVIVAIDGDEPADRRRLSTALSEKSESETIELAIVRRGKRLRLTVGVTRSAPEAVSPLRELLSGGTASANEQSQALARIERELARSSKLAAEAGDLKAHREILAREQATLAEALAQIEREDPAAAGAPLTRLRERIAEMTEAQRRLGVEEADRHAEGQRMMARALEGQLARLDATRARLLSDADRLDSQLDQRQAAVDALLATEMSQEAAAKARALLRDDYRALTDRYREAANQLQNPEVQLSGDTALLTGRLGGARAAAARDPSVDDRLGELEDRLANIEAMLKKLVAQRDQGDR